MFAHVAPIQAATRTGLDVLVASKFVQLSGKRVALILNQTSRSADGELSPDLFLKQKACTLVALFTPEHGLSGIRKAGVTSDSAETYHGIPVFSLYGSTRKPTKHMLRGVDVLVFDIQDIGVRAYTFLSTMILSMEAAAQNNVAFVVLDRPNPLGGERIEGNVLDPSLRSFVGQVGIPYIYGMTLGEIAMMAKAEHWFKAADKLKLTVVKMQGWSRAMTWPQTKLKWTAPSPNIPTYESAVGCAMFGALGELGVLSVGIGSDAPFLRLGSHLVRGNELLADAEASLSSELQIARHDFSVPYADSSKSYYGVSVVVPKELGEVGQLYAPQFKLFRRLLENKAFAKAYDAVVFSSKRMFEKVTGTTQILAAFEGDASSLDGVLASWKNDESQFRILRKPYLLYK